MNIKISKELHDKLECNFPYQEYLFGSQLHGIANEDSDYDYVRVISDEFYNQFKTKARFLPNIHSFQYSAGKEIQYIWMTESQFFRNLFSGDGNMIADIVLLNTSHPDYSSRMQLCRCYRVIKGYLGVAKRDLKLHGNWDKKIFHASRSLYMAETLMDDVYPTVEDIVTLKNINIPLTKEELVKKEKDIRLRLNGMLEKGEITLCPIFEEGDELVNIMNKSNNIKEFKYD